MLSNKIAELFRQIGSALFIRGLNHSHSGNLSIRIGNKIYITRRGSMKGFLKRNDIICTGIKPSPKDKLASTEINVHRAIYNTITAGAIVHCHPPITTALAFSRNEIIPIDVEGLISLPKIPVLECIKATASKELEEKLPPLLHKYKSVVVKGHGIFTVGQTLEDAFHYATLTEHISAILYYTEGA